MLFAGANVALLYRTFMGRPRDLVRDPDFRAYGAILAVAAVGMTVGAAAAPRSPHGAGGGHLRRRAA
ncbi:hypothetical protein BH23DEI1_BH23DEI1_19530 [soil metagenome]